MADDVITPAGHAELVPDKTIFPDKAAEDTGRKLNPVQAAIAKAQSALAKGQSLGTPLGQAQSAEVVVPQVEASNDPAKLSSMHPRDLAAMGIKTAEPALPTSPVTQDSGSVKTTDAEIEVSWNETAQRWQGPDGKFHEGEAPEGIAIDATRPREAVTAAESTNTATPLESLAESVQSGETPALDPAPITITLPGRNAGDAELEIEVADEETAERLNQLKNGYMRGEQVKATKAEAAALRADVADREAQLAAVEDMMIAGPEVFLLDRIPAATQTKVAQQLVLEHWDTMKDQLEAWMVDDVARREAKVTANEERSSMREAVSSRASAQREGQAIHQNIQALVPEGLDADRANAFVKYALNELAALSRTRDIRPADVSGLVQPMMKLFGLNEAATTEANTATTSRLSGNATAAPNTGATTAPAVATKTAITKKIARVTPKAITDARANAAALTPAGAGAVPVQRPAMPKGMNLASTIDYLRKGGAQIKV